MGHVARRCVKAGLAFAALSLWGAACVSSGETATQTRAPLTVLTFTPDGVTVREGQIYQDVPALIDAEQRYVIYLHGRIIEDEGTRPVSPTYGVYEYEETLTALSQAGLSVITEARPANTDTQQYATRVVNQVNSLLDAGVPAEHVTIMGFSKGGAIAIFASSMLQNRQVNVVLLAICGEWVFEWSNVELTGRVLSIYETSDEYGHSCASLVEVSPGVSDFEEIVLSTGRQHGAFYVADDAWLEPVTEWILAVP